MKIFKNTLLAFTTLTALFGCEKEKEEPACVGPVKITFQNTRNYPVRIELAAAFDAQLNPINPLFVIDLPAFGTSAKKEYPSENRYKLQWKKNCATTCVQMSFGDASNVPCADITDAQ
jgi:hypothetical protein